MTGREITVYIFTERHAPARPSFEQLPRAFYNNIGIEIKNLLRVVTLQKSLQKSRFVGCKMHGDFELFKTELEPLRDRKPPKAIRRTYRILCKGRQGPSKPTMHNPAKASRINGIHKRGNPMIVVFFKKRANKRWHVKLKTEFRPLRHVKFDI